MNASPLDVSSFDEAPVLFVDRSLESRSLVELLRAAGARIESHSAHFAHDSPDVEWLPPVARNGWIVLTLDKHLVSRPLELRAIRISRSGVLIVKADSLPHAQIAAILVAHLSKIQNLRHVERPFVARLYRDGKINFVALPVEEESQE